jgi:predicted MFS family arabinose efflux permease
LCRTSRVLSLRRGARLHQVAYLRDLGFPAGRVTAAIGAIGVISLPGRFLIPVLGDHVRPPLLIVAVFALLAVSALLLFEAGEWWRVYLYVALFGTVFGAMSRCGLW